MEKRHRGGPLVHSELHAIVSPEWAPRRTRVFLCVPPVWELSFQSVGIPAMAAWCRMLGYDTQSRDLNIAFHRYRSGTDTLDLAGAADAYDCLLANPVFAAQYVPRLAEEKIRLRLPFGLSELVCNNYSRIAEFIE